MKKIKIIIFIVVMVIVSAVVYLHFAKNAFGIMASYNNNELGIKIKVPAFWKKTKIVAYKTSDEKNLVSFYNTLDKEKILKVMVYKNSDIEKVSQGIIQTENNMGGNLIDSNNIDFYGNPAKKLIINHHQKYNLIDDSGEKQIENYFIDYYNNVESKGNVFSINYSAGHAQIDDAEKIINYFGFEFK